MLVKMLVVGIGGFVGANIRYGMSLWIESGHFPLATFIINILGCFGLALFATLVNERIEIAETTRLLVSTGFFGAFTTFSTFNIEALNLFSQGKSSTALLYLSLSVVIGLIAGAAGVFLGQRI